MENNDKVMYFVPEVPGTPWEKCARLIEMAEDAYSKALVTLDTMRNQLNYGLVYLKLAQDNLNSHQMKFDAMLLERLRTCGIPADEANWIYGKIAPKRVEDSLEHKEETL